MSRTQKERSAATQEAVLSAARRLWGERGYAGASTPEIAEAAGVTRGAMYHQYANKTELFVAVLEAIETEVIELRDSKSRPDQGIVTFMHRAYNQRNELVASCKRSGLQRRRPAP